MRSRVLFASTLLAASAAAQPAEPGPVVAGTTTEPATEAPPVEAVVTTPPVVVASPGLDAAQVNALIDDRLAARKDTAGFKDGFFVQTSDAKTKLKIGGFTQFDGRFFVAEGNDPHTDTFGFRSIRPDLQGTLFEHFDFRLLPDFAGARIVLQDVYADIHYTDVVKVRFGKFKVPFGLERLQGETNTLFVERGLPRSSHRTAISASRCSARSARARSRTRSASSTASPMARAATAMSPTTRKPRRACS